MLVLLGWGLAIIVTLHAVLFKKDVRSAMGWIVVSWLWPIWGAVFYFFLGINRTERKAKQLRKSKADLEKIIQEIPEHCKTHIPKNLLPLLSISNQLSGLPITTCQSVRALFDSEKIFETMLQAIDEAKLSVSLMVYIFDDDEVGYRFVEACVRAKKRGVKVRVLIDDLGTGSIFSKAKRKLENNGIEVQVFHRTLFSSHLPFVNLRNHRKLLIVDQKRAFTGGVNISQRHLKKVRDVHFEFMEVTPGIVEQFNDIFDEDWEFSGGTKNVVVLEETEKKIDSTANIFVRAIPDGPYGQSARIRNLYVAALSVAQQKVSIVTPYFLPDPTLIVALNMAAHRGVSVEIFIPQKSDNRLVDWATRATLWQVLQSGCQVFFTQEPFDHSKLMVVDEHWVFLGSANWDPRSLRLNFELNVEVYDHNLALTMIDWLTLKSKTAKKITLKEIDTRNWLIKVRDGICRLLSPYL